MAISAHEPSDLQRIYASRFEQNLDYRRQVWRILIKDFFQAYVKPTDTVLDLGCGYGEFINLIQCGKKFAMDLNPDMSKRIDPDVTGLLQDCTTPWTLPENSLDVVFTSNFFEHLPDKASLGETLNQVRRSLKKGGILIALGPNIKYLPGKYWEFWDHYVPLSENSLKEALENRGFKVEVCHGRFLPYTMADGKKHPLIFLRLYLRLKMAWPLLGKQFLLIART